MIDPDNEAQEAIDNEEAEAAEFADNQTDPAEDAASEEGGEMEYLKELERLDRQIMAAEALKAGDASKHNTKIRGLYKQQKVILDELEKFRLGERGLPYGENA